MSYDAAARRLVLFGGAIPSFTWPEMFSDTWLFGALTPATARPGGNPCPGSNGPPVLTSTAPYLGHPAFRLELLSARPRSACVFGFAASPASVPIGSGCTLFLQSPIVTVPAVTNAFGFAEHAPFPIPTDIALRGVAFYGQAVVVDSFRPVLGLAFSAGRQLVVGD